MENRTPSPTPLIARGGPRAPTGTRAPSAASELGGRRHRGRARAEVQDREHVGERGALDERLDGQVRARARQPRGARGRERDEAAQSGDTTAAACARHAPRAPSSRAAELAAPPATRSSVAATPAAGQSGAARATSRGAHTPRPSPAARAEHERGDRSEHAEAVHLKHGEGARRAGRGGRTRAASEAMSTGARARDGAAREGEVDNAPRRSTRATARR